eukprot:9204322-Prorocentrum_lima.AAC.1
MTSSLVGSEMCIRDSQWPSPVEPSQNGAVHLFNRTNSTRVVHPQPVTPCLLYTSDAADDM